MAADALQPPRPRTYGRINGRGLWSLMRRDLRRFWRYGAAGLGGPVVSGLMFMAVFVLALGGAGRGPEDLTFAQFVAPGIAAFSLVHAAFSNGAVPIIYDKNEGMIGDILSAPLTPLEVTAGYALAAMVNGIAVGAAVLAVLAVFVDLPLGQAAAILLFAPAGSLAFALTGVLVGLWADRWDNYSAADSFLILPLGVLSGAFFPLEGVPAAARSLVLLNPAFHAVDGLRYAATGYSAWSPWASLAILLAVDLVLAIIAWRLFTAGYKIKP
jgi:ABC-2 type transport system permease protein